MPGSFLTAWQSEQLHGYSCGVRDNSHRLQLKRFRLDMEQDFFSKRVVQPCNTPLGWWGISVWGSFQDLEGFGWTKATCCTAGNGCTLKKAG